MCPYLKNSDKCVMHRLIRWWFSPPIYHRTSSDPLPPHNIGSYRIDKKKITMTLNSLEYNNVFNGV